MNNWFVGIRGVDLNSDSINFLFLSTEMRCIIKSDILPMIEFESVYFEMIYFSTYKA